MSHTVQLIQPTSDPTSILPGLANEDQLWLERKRQVWFIPLAYERGVACKTEIPWERVPYLSTLASDLFDQHWRHSLSQRTGTRSAVGALCVMRCTVIIIIILEVCSWRGTIQIHVYLTLPLLKMFPVRGVCCRECFDTVLIVCVCDRRLTTTCGSWRKVMTSWCLGRPSWLQQQVTMASWRRSGLQAVVLCWTHHVLPTTIPSTPQCTAASIPSLPMNSPHGRPNGPPCTLALS